MYRRYCAEKVVQKNVVQELLIRKVLYRKSCKEHIRQENVAQERLYIKCCTGNVVQEMLYIKL